MKWHLKTSFRLGDCDVVWWGFRKMISDGVGGIIGWGTWPHEWKRPMFSFLHLGPAEFRFWRREPYGRS